MSRPLSELLVKYNQPGPRYTSYPTVPAWTETVGSSDYETSLKNLSTEDPLSLYFHIPFCEKLCHFCGCLKVITQNRSKSAEYIKVLLKELDQVAKLIPAQTRTVSQLHFGGGTPNFLQPEELTQVMTSIRQHFKLLPDGEVAIEMHPRTSTRAFCDNLKTQGFNRISLGVQDFDPKVQQLINRFQDYEMTAEMISYLRSIGFDAFNFDLIYGLPGQCMNTWKKTLQQVLELRPDRLAVYSYAHVPWKAPVQRSFKDSDLPSPELKLELFEVAYKTFTQQGYRLIGMDHFALETDELSLAAQNGSLHRNFMGYSTRASSQQIGVGMSAISYISGNYFQNHKTLKEYYGSLEKGSLATFRGFLLNRDDHIRRAVITQIMCNGSVNYTAFKQQWGIDFLSYFNDEHKRLESFIQDELLVSDAEGIRVIDHGFLFLRNIAMTFDTYLDDIRTKAETPVFSKTV